MIHTVVCSMQAHYAEELDLIHQRLSIIEQHTEVKHPGRIFQNSRGAIQIDLMLPTVMPPNYRDHLLQAVREIKGEAGNDYRIA